MLTLTTDHAADLLQDVQQAARALERVIAEHRIVPSAYRFALEGLCEQERELSERADDRWD